MFTCLPCSKSLDNDGGSENPDQRAATLISQMKELALKATGAYKMCKPSRKHARSEEFRYSYRRAEDISSISTPIGGTTPSPSGQVEPVAFTEEDEPKEWVAQVEPGVLITFVSLPRGGNELKRIRFRFLRNHHPLRHLLLQNPSSQELFTKWQAQQWWEENSDKVVELYNVRQPEDEEESERASDAPTGEAALEEREWVEEDVPGVYITIRVLGDGTRELVRVRFSREKFGESSARVWWDDNRERIQQRYL